MRRMHWRLSVGDDRRHPSMGHARLRGSKASRVRRHASVHAAALFFCAAGWAVNAPTIDVPPISSAFDAMDATISGEGGEVVRVHLLSNVLGEEVSYSWAEYKLPAGKSRLLDLKPTAGLTEIDSRWSLFWSQRPVRDGGPLKLYGEHLKDLDADTRYLFLLEIAGEFIEKRKVQVARDRRPSVRPYARGRVSGTMYVPRSVGPHPALLIIGGHPPRELSHLGQAFAARGIMVFHISYHVERGGKQCFSDVPAEIFEDALADIRAMDSVDAARIGMLGISRGAEVIPYIARRANGVGFAIMASFSAWPLGGGCGGAPWTVAGKPVGVLPSSGWQRGDTQAARILRRVRAAGLQDSPMLPMGLVDVPTLMIGAEYDETVPSVLSVDRICAMYGCGGGSLFTAFEAKGADHLTVHLPWLPFPCQGNGRRGPSDLFGRCETAAVAIEKTYSRIAAFIAEHAGISLEPD